MPAARLRGVDGHRARPAIIPFGAVSSVLYTVVNARLERDALRLGRPTFLTPAEATSTSKSSDGLIDRPWEFWKIRALRK